MIPRSNHCIGQSSKQSQIQYCEEKEEEVEEEEEEEEEEEV